jgi:hypothetical protein
MPVDKSLIKWGTYQLYEGPYYRGTHAYVVPEAHDELDVWLAVITATEGGRYDAINMYDRMIISVGIIQWGEASQYSVTSLLAAIADRCGEKVVLDALQPAMSKCNVSFKKNSSGRWRFFFNDFRGEVDTVDKQRQMFLGCSGQKGSWGAYSKDLAFTWVSCVVDALTTECAKKVQAEFTKNRLRGFYTADARKILLEDKTDNEYANMLRAAYVSFAANLPAIASKYLVEAAQSSKYAKWSRDWCIDILSNLTFGPNIGIYPMRYNLIRPVLEKYYGVDLPKTAKNLAEAAAQHNTDITVPPAEDTLPSTPPPPPEPKIPQQPIFIDVTFDSNDTPTKPVDIQPIVVQRKSFFDAFLEFIKMMLTFLFRARKLRSHDETQANAARTNSFSAYEP